MSDAIPFVDLAAQRRRLGRPLMDAITQVIEHGRYVLGPEVAELERELAVRSGVARAVTCGSGTGALQLAFMAWGVGRGDAVVLPAFTFVATAEAIVLAGATPVFVDVRDDDANLDATQIRQASVIARDLGLRPRAVIAVGLYGQPCDEEAVAEAAASEDLLVLGDAAQSYGARFRGRDTAAFGDASATSFFPAKPLGCYGDGGAVLTNDVELADTLVSLRMHGFGAHRYEHVRIGCTDRLDTIQAAVLLQKLTVFDDELAARQQVADRYAAAFRQTAVDEPLVQEGRTSAWAQYTIRLDKRQHVADRLAEVGIPTAVHYPLPLHRQPAYCSFPTVAARLPVAERLSERVLSLPMHPYLEAEVQDRITRAVISAVEELA